MSEVFYTVRDDNFMDGYAQVLSEDGHFDTLGKMTREQAEAHLRAKGYTTLHYLPPGESGKEAAMRREQHRKVEPKKPVTAFDIFCLIAEIMELRERRRLREEIDEAVYETQGS
jgi:hypothetical protein